MRAYFSDQDSFGFTFDEPVRQLPPGISTDSPGHYVFDMQVGQRLDLEILTQGITLLETSGYSPIYDLGGQRVSKDVFLAHFLEG